GIIMLADAVEASVRSLKDKSVDNIRRTVAKMVNEIYEEGELNESGLTLKDLESIIDEFTKVLSSMYHKRIEYPSNGGEKSDESERAG
ncbi:MAG: phosphohydrolase, partial [Thermotogae bacterium]|nr:phosphohydrolase [Thermotogota bacterium]